MFARIVGVLTAIAVFFLYFSLIGARPVYETLLGVVLAVAGGGWAWFETQRRVRRSHGQGADRRGADGP